MAAASRGIGPTLSDLPGQPEGQNGPAELNWSWLAAKRIIALRQVRDTQAMAGTRLFGTAIG